MIIKKQILKQTIIDGNSTPNEELLKVNSVITDLGVYSIPGSKILINGAEILINNTGLLQIHGDNIEITSIQIPKETIELLQSSQIKMSIDYMGYRSEEV